MRLIPRKNKFELKEKYQKKIKRAWNKCENKRTEYTLNEQ